MANNESSQSKSQATSQATSKEAPKAEQANPFAAFDPMGYWAAAQAQSQKMMSEAFGRTQQFADQYAAIESQFVSRAQQAVASWAQMTQDAIAYAAQLSAEARKLGLETARKMSAGA